MSDLRVLCRPSSSSLWDWKIRLFRQLALEVCGLCVIGSLLVAELTQDACRGSGKTHSTQVAGCFQLVVNHFKLDSDVLLSVNQLFHS